MAKKKKKMNLCQEKLLEHLSEVYIINEFFKNWLFSQVNFLGLFNVFLRKEYKIV